MRLVQWYGAIVSSSDLDELKELMDLGDDPGKMEIPTLTEADLSGIEDVASLGIQTPTRCEDEDCLEEVVPGEEKTGEDPYEEDGENSDDLADSARHRRLSTIGRRLETNDTKYFGPGCVTSEEFDIQRPFAVTCGNMIRKDAKINVDGRYLPAVVFSPNGDQGSGVDQIDCGYIITKDQILTAESTWAKEPYGFGSFQIVVILNMQWGGFGVCFDPGLNVAALYVARKDDHSNPTAIYMSGRVNHVYE